MSDKSKVETETYATLRPAKMDNYILSAMVDKNKPVPLQYIMDQLRHVAGKYPDPIIVAKALQSLIEQGFVKITPTDGVDYGKVRFYLA